jgi:hypothetical protein
MTAIENIAATMKSFAFDRDTMFGSPLRGGRGTYLDQIAADPAIPGTPGISYSGAAGFPVGGLAFTSSAFSDPQGSGTAGKIEWRIAEVRGLAPGGPVTLVASGDTWKYFDAGTDPGTTWAEHDYDDSSWGSGPTQIGYGESDQATTVAGGHATTYFRKVITLADPALHASFDAGAVRDDGAIVYVNGVEVWRNQMPAGPVDFTTVSSATASGSNETDFHPFTIPSERFFPGDNTIAVEVHQHDPASGDMSFDFQLTATPVPPAPGERVYEWDATWESGELMPTQDSISPPAVATRPGRTYRARVRHADNTGRWSHWSAPLEFTTSVPDISLFTSSLVISEVMYHPADPTPAEFTAGFDDDDVFEYVEVRNVGTQSIDLSNLRFTKGVEFDFAGSGVTSLAPGSNVLVVSNLSAFTMRHGAGLPVAGEWTSKLDNGGERLKLSYGAGEAVRDFVYDDLPDWPTSPDGAGPSLVLVDPHVLPDHGDPFNWRASVAAGGSPGSTDGTTFPGGTDDEFLAYAMAGPPVLGPFLPDGKLTLSIELNRLAEDVSGWLEVSTDLIDWQPAGPSMTRTAVEPTTGGFARVTFTTTPPPAAPRWFVRYAVQGN